MVIASTSGETSIAKAPEGQLARMRHKPYAVPLLDVEHSEWRLAGFARGERKEGGKERRHVTGRTSGAPVSGRLSWSLPAVLRRAHSEQAWTRVGSRLTLRFFLL